MSCLKSAIYRCLSNSPTAARFLHFVKTKVKVSALQKCQTVSVALSSLQLLFSASMQETMLLIDEPERHLHRSIIEPFLSALFKLREDCAFIIATHEVALPVANKDARTLVIHSCEWNGQQAGAWDVNILEETTHLPEELKQTILGGRRRILFVEGVETSLDKTLYSLIFPMVSVIPKGSCHEVEQAVSGLRDGAGLHWLEVFGIVDGDGLDPGEIAGEAKEGCLYPSLLLSRGDLLPPTDY